MHLNRKSFTFLTACALLALAAAPALACTGITVKARDGAVIHARTLEFAQDLHSHVLMIPRGYALVSPGPGGKPGLSWKAKYAALGMNFLGETNLADGMNEKGPGRRPVLFTRLRKVPRGFAWRSGQVPGALGRARLGVDPLRRCG